MKAYRVHFPASLDYNLWNWFDKNKGQERRSEVFEEKSDWIFISKIIGFTLPFRWIGGGKYVNEFLIYGPDWRCDQCVATLRYWQFRNLLSWIATICTFGCVPKIKFYSNTGKYKLENGQWEISNLIKYNLMDRDVLEKKLLRFTGSPPTQFCTFCT